MPRHDNDFFTYRYKHLYFLFAILSCYSFLTNKIAYGQAIGGYAPAARSATSGNTMLDNVVGNRHSPVKTQTAENGALYHIAEDGTVTTPNGLIVNAGCIGKNGKPVPEIHSKYSFGIGRRGKGFETVLIGVSSEPILVTTDASNPHEQTVRRATLNASFAPSDVYVLPRPCNHETVTDKTLTNDAAASLASADGNAFTLAGNRDNVKDVDDSQTFLNGDIKLLSTATTASDLGGASP